MTYSNKTFGSPLPRPRPHKPTEQQFIQAAAEQRKQSAALELFAEQGANSKEERIQRGLADPFFFYATYLPHFFGNDKADWHDEYVGDLQLTDQLLAVTAQRDGAKSTILFAEIVRWICYRKHKLIIYRLDSLEKAEFYTERILIEFQHNPRLRHDFGALVTKDASRRDFVCSDPKTHATITRIVAFGAGMSLRGFINENTRPDVIINEDLQDRDSAESEKRTNKEIRRLLHDARPALTVTGWKFIVIGNIICSNSLMDRLLDPKQYKAFLKRRYSAEYTDEFGVRHSTWNSRYPLSQLDKVRFEIGDDAYEVEFLCRTVEVGSIFKAKRDIHRWSSLPVEIDYSQVLVQVDPALSGFNDDTALGVLVNYFHDLDRPDYGTWCDENGEPFGEGTYTILLAVYCRQAGIDETITASYEYYEQYHGTDFHIDGSVDKEIVFERFFGAYEVKTGKRLPIIYDKFLTSKEARIKALQPLMQRRRVLLPPGDSEDVKNLIRQLTRFGKSGERDDGPDMLAAAVENLDPEYGLGRTEVYIL